jgi:hypothetical protein
LERTLGKGLRQIVQIGCTSVVAVRMVGPEGVAEMGSTLLLLRSYVCMARWTSSYVGKAPLRS